MAGINPYLWAIVSVFIAYQFRGEYSPQGSEEERIADNKHSLFVSSVS